MFKLLLIIVVFVIALFFGKLTLQFMKKRKLLLTIASSIIVLFTVLFGAAGIASYFNNGQNAQMPKNSSSVKKQSSSSDHKTKSDNSLTDSEKDEVHQEKMKNIAQQLNNQFSQQPELKGFSVEPDGDSWKVVVPESLATASDNEQKENFSACAGLIEKAMGEDSQMCAFYSPSGQMLGRTKMFSDDIKLTN